MPTLNFALFQARAMPPQVGAVTPRRNFHCRDKIEFNLKSQKLEEPVFAVLAANPLCSGMETLAAGVGQSTGILNFLQLSRCLHSRVAAVCIPFGSGARKLSNTH
jgi:hypothetical protein